MTETLRQAAPPPTSAPLEFPADEHTLDTAVAYKDAGPTVVIKRRKTMGRGAHATPAPQELVDAERVPRVFRVASAMQDAEANHATQDGHQNVMDDSNPAAADAVRPAAGARRRRRVPRPPVTIIRPGEDGHATIASPSESPGTPASPSVSVEPDLRFGQSRDDHRRYVELQLEIEALQRELEVLKKAEATVAVRWIRKAIAKYGLGAAELGL